MNALCRITGAWAIPFAVQRLAGWVDANADAIKALSATQTIGERLYPIPNEPPQFPREPWERIPPWQRDLMRRIADNSGETVMLVPRQYPQHNPYTTERNRP